MVTVCDVCDKCLVNIEKALLNVLVLWIIALCYTRKHWNYIDLIRKPPKKREKYIDSGMVRQKTITITGKPHLPRKLPPHFQQSQRDWLGLNRTEPGQEEDAQRASLTNRASTGRFAWVLCGNIWGHTIKSGTEYRKETVWDLKNK